MNSRLAELVSVAAEACRSAGVPIDSNPNGAVHQWVIVYCQFRPGTEFFLVALICAEMADQEARIQGFLDQFDRALKSLTSRSADANT